MALNPKHAAAAVPALEAYIVQLEKDQSAIVQKLAEAREALRGMQRQCPQTSGAVGKTRRQKGENLKMLREQFRSNPNAGMTAAVLANKIGVAQSSIQNVLKRSQEFTQDDAGLWTWKGEAAA